MRIAYAFACCLILLCILLLIFFYLCICYHNLVNKDVYIKMELVYGRVNVLKCGAIDYMQHPSLYPSDPSQKLGVQTPNIPSLVNALFR